MTIPSSVTFHNILDRVGKTRFVFYYETYFNVCQLAAYCKSYLITVQSTPTFDAFLSFDIDNGLDQNQKSEVKSIMYIGFMLVPPLP